LKPNRIRRIAGGFRFIWLAFDDAVFQMLKLSLKPVECSMPKEYPADIAWLISQSLKEV
jgi:hypothetical protein